MRAPLFAALVGLASAGVVAQADTTAAPAPGADVADLPEIVARQWAAAPVDLHNLEGNVVLLLFWQKPTGT